MDKDCICASPLNKVSNSHNDERNIELILLTKKDDEGIVIFENNIAIACFDIKYCPMCGRNLSYTPQGSILKKTEPLNTTSPPQ